MTRHVHGRNVTVIGLGKSGYSAALFLLKQGAHVWVTDSSSSQIVFQRAEQLIQKCKNLFGNQDALKIEIGKHTCKWVEGKDFAVVSPGIPPQSPPLVWASQYSIPVIGELELASGYFSGKIIAVTGTNGKSTVTTLIGRLLTEGGFDCQVGGNIGTPWIDLVEGATQETVAVVEVSSFQLETIHRFRPWIAVLLNITPDHMDRYASLHHYRRTKLRIFENQTESDWAVVGESVQDLLGDFRPRVRTFQISDLDRANLNLSAARVVSEVVGISSDVVGRVFQKFQGLEHRLETVAEHGGVRYINDSKSTTTASTLWALQRVQGPGIWILGGRDKGADFKVLRKSLSKHARGVIAMGEARGNIKRALSREVPLVMAKGLRQAVGMAERMAKDGDAIVLSPACTSFDEFANFEERGRAFKVLVKNELVGA